MRLYFGWSLGTLAMSESTQYADSHAHGVSDQCCGRCARTGQQLVFVSKIYDGVTDPVMGIIGDRTNSRWGRRRPYLLLGGLLAALSVIGLFSGAYGDLCADTQHLVLAMLLVAATAYTTFNVPYMSMPAEMVQEPYEPLKTDVLQGGLDFGGHLCQDRARPRLVAHARDTLGMAETDAFGMMSLITGAIILVASVALFCYDAGCGGDQRTRVNLSIREQARSALTNRPFLILLAIKYLGLYALSATVATNIFFVRQVMQQSEAIMLWYGLAYMLGTLLAIAPVGINLQAPE